MSLQKLSLEELTRMNETLHLQSPDEQRLTLERLLATLPPETQELFQKLEAETNAREPRPKLLEISGPSLRALAVEDLDFAIFEYVAERLSKTDAPNAELLTLPRGLQVFYLSFLVEAEVMNGGFNQFFWNSSGAMADLIAPALRDLGAHDAADIFEQAWALAKVEASLRSPFKEERSLDAFSRSYAETRLGQFDAPFGRIAQWLPSLRADFIKAHEDWFLA